jgi:hypothetical protein
MKTGDWEFYHAGWDSSNDSYPRHVTDKNMFPQKRKGCLDAEKLYAFGLKKTCMKGCDVIFFYQLLFPIWVLKRSGVQGDRQMPCYTDVTAS